jgi:ComF family protein
MPPLRLPPAVLTAWPGRCGICRGWGRGPVCADCLARYTAARLRCARCAIEVPAGQALCGACLREPPPFESSVAAFDYAAPWDRLITRFKFHAALDLAALFAAHLAAAVHARDTSAPALLLPMPLSRARLRERGYNQAWELTRRIARLRRLHGDARLLLRVRDTPHQIALPVEQRAANVRGAFAVEPRRRAELAGLDIALVDDVMTSGATAAEAARVLLAAGAARVRVWIVARTPRPD